MRPTPCGCTSARLSGFTGLPLMRWHRNCRSAGPFFSVLPEKNGEKRGAGTIFIALARLNKRFVIRYVLSFCFRSQNSLRAARTISALGMSECGKYLTYGNR